MSVLKPGFGKLATIGEAFEILERCVPHLGHGSVALGDALHRVCAVDQVCSIDVPHFTKAAMDGYAVIASDTFGSTDGVPVQLEVVETVMPGTVPSIAVTAGTCVEIGTGAPLPDGADAVVMVEQTEVEGTAVMVRKAVAPRENVIEVGSDLKSGDLVVPRGTRLEPHHLGALAAAGLLEVPVFDRLQVALFSTGPEIVRDPDELRKGTILDINSYTLAAALQQDGCTVVDMGVVPDESGPLEQAVRQGLASADMVLLSGGSSLGGGDLVVEVFSRIGEMLLHGVAVKPGKPLVVGLASSKAMIGLPGYPMSALSDYLIFVRWLIRRANAMSAPVLSTSAVLGRKHPSTVGRYEFLPVRLEAGVAVPLTKGSSAITALAQADGFIEIEENTEVLEKGQPVTVRLF